ncbi:MAG TPA: hypothetical protein VG826_32510 [Pirellulales bacterium]|nr:hypothetical protein [Pirellulales bacterium]
MSYENRSPPVAGSSRAEGAGDSLPTVDEIRDRCALLLSEDFAAHTVAYLGLRDCHSFCRVVERFREHELTLFDVAAILASGANRPLTGTAVQMLTAELADDAGGQAREPN